MLTTRKEILTLTKHYNKKLVQLKKPYFKNTNNKTKYTTLVNRYRKPHMPWNVQKVILQRCNTDREWINYYGAKHDLRRKLRNLRAMERILLPEL